MSFSLCILMGKFNEETLHKEENDKEICLISTLFSVEMGGFL